MYVVGGVGHHAVVVAPTKAEQLPLGTRGDLGAEQRGVDHVFEVLPNVEGRIRRRCRSERRPGFVARGDGGDARGEKRPDVEGAQSAPSMGSNSVYRDDRRDDDQRTQDDLRRHRSPVPNRRTRGPTRSRYVLSGREPPAWEPVKGRCDSRVVAFAEDDEVVLADLEGNEFCVLTPHPEQT